MVLLQLRSAQQASIFDFHQLPGHCQQQTPPQYTGCVQYGETFSLLDWFMQFCAVFNSPREEEDASLDAQKPAKPLVKQRKRGSRKVLVVSALLAVLSCDQPLYPGLLRLAQQLGQEQVHCLPASSAPGRHAQHTSTEDQCLIQQHLITCSVAEWSTHSTGSSVCQSNKGYPDPVACTQGAWITACWRPPALPG